MTAVDPQKNLVTRVNAGDVLTRTAWRHPPVRSCGRRRAPAHLSCAERRGEPAGQRAVNRGLPAG